MALLERAEARPDSYRDPDWPEGAGLREGLIKLFRAAWERQIPGMECPIRFEVESEWHHLKPPRGGWVMIQREGR